MPDKMTPSTHNLAVIRRHLHIVALMLNEKDSWNAEKLAKFLSSESDSDSGVDGKTVRLDLQKNIQKTLGISFDTQKGHTKTKLSGHPDKKTLLNLLSLYAEFIIQDTSRTIAFNKLIDRQGSLSLWNLARIHFAIITRNKISFSYTTNVMKNRSASMNPYHIVSRDRTVYLLGKRDKDNTVGLYIFDRINNLKVDEDKHFNEVIPSVEEHFKHSHGLFIWNWSPPGKVTIRYSLKLESSMLDEFQHLKPEKPKRFASHIEMSFFVHDYEGVCRQLFFYGKNVEIISPPEVRDHMIKMLQNSMLPYQK